MPEEFERSSTFCRCESASCDKRLAANLVRNRTTESCFQARNLSIQRPQSVLGTVLAR